jgi:hypothetical protein
MTVVNTVMSLQFSLAERLFSSQENSASQTKWTRTWCFDTYCYDGLKEPGGGKQRYLNSTLLTVMQFLWLIQMVVTY